MHRFFLPASAFQGERVIIQSAPARQIARVLRLQPGEKVLVLDNQGSEYLVCLEQVAADRVVAKIEEVHPATGISRHSVTLYQALLKGERFEWVLQKATELGVSAIVPVYSQRTIPRYSAPEQGRKMARWGRIVQEASEQCGRGRLPILGEPIGFLEACRLAKGFSYLPWEEEKERSFTTCLQEVKVLADTQPSLAINLFIGPEGGFDPNEAAYGERHGIVSVSLGERILRSETAAMAALTLLFFVLGEIK